MRIDIPRLRTALAVRAAEPPSGHDTFKRPGAKDAAVVVPIRLDPEPFVIAELRALHLADHPGEVAFPGGKPEPHDVDLWATALREMEEEIGVRASEVERLGELSAIYVLTGRYRIHPYVVAILEGASPRVETGEIARLIEIPMLPWLKGDRPIRGVSFEWNGAAFVAPHFELDGCVLYGASAYIFYELLGRVAAALGLELPPLVMQHERPWRALEPR